jgi:hypothetical protein
MRPQSECIDVPPHLIKRPLQIRWGFTCSNVQTFEDDPKFVAVCDACDVHIRFNRGCVSGSNVFPNPTPSPHFPWLNPICPQAIRQQTLPPPTSLQYSRQRQTTTRLSRDEIYEHIHWPQSSRVTTAHLIPSWLYFESRLKPSTSFAMAMTS